MCGLSHVWLFVTPWTIYSLPGSSVHGVFQGGKWSGLLFSSPGIFLTQGLNPWHEHWQVDSLPQSQREAKRWGHQFSSVQFSRSVVSDSLWPHELQHARPPCPSPTPRVHPNSCPSSWWCHPTISSSVIPFSCPQSLPASESFPMSQLLAWGGQSIGVSALASVLHTRLLIQ